MTAFVRKAMAFDDGVISYLEWEGPRKDALHLHFSHANGFNAETYAELLAPLANRFRITASDLRGHGFTTRPTPPGKAVGWTVYRDDTIDFLRRLAAGPSILAGHSLGSIASLMTAAKEPSLARALLLIEPILVPSRLKLALMRRMGRDIEGSSLAERAIKRRDQFPSREAALAAYRGRGAFAQFPNSMIAAYLKGGLLLEDGGMRLACAPHWEAEAFRFPALGVARLGSRISCPVTLIYGGKGSTDPKLARDFARRHGLTRLLKLEDATHFLPMAEPNVVRAEARRLADIVETPSRLSKVGVEPRQNVFGAET